MAETNILDFIKKEMAARGMTYELLAGKAGMSRQNLWMKLNKDHKPNVETVRKILDALGYDIEIEKRPGCDQKPDPDAVAEFLALTDDEQVSFECVEALLSSVGYEIKLKSRENEENTENITTE